MEFLYTYAVSVAFTLYFGYVLIAGIDNAADSELRGWLKRSRTLLVGVGFAIVGGLLGYVVVATQDTHERWSFVLGVAVVCGALTTLVAGWADHRLRGHDVD